MSNSPYTSPETTGNPMKPAKRPSPMGRIVFYSFAVLIIVILIGMLLPAVRRGHPRASRRMECMNNTRQIMLAMLNYESVNGKFPPAYTVDADGKRLHSWRTLILPYLEEGKLYDTIDFTKPWDDPANKNARETRIPTYSCPSIDLEDGLTTYLGVFGDRSFFTGSNAQRINDFTDGTTQTIAVCEVDSSHAVHWMSPQDASVEMILSHGPNSMMNHAGTLNVAFVDGSTMAIYLEKGNEEYESLKGWLSTKKQMASGE